MSERIFQGFVHSGDLGHYDEDGFLFIGGRQKEIIVTGGGENVAPVPIEDAIKLQLKEIISNCMVIGDKRKHLACILTLRTVLDSANLPTNELHPDVKEVNFVCVIILLFEIKNKSKTNIKTTICAKICQLLGFAVGGQPRR